jgi:hypothetical protein
MSKITCPDCDNSEDWTFVIETAVWRSVTIADDVVTLGEQIGESKYDRALVCGECGRQIQEPELRNAFGRTVQEAK